MSAPIVTICGCSHAERMHERDSGAEHDRGACLHGSCGCTEYRPSTSATPAPSTTAAPATAPTPAVTAPRTLFPCTEPGCAETFERPQALGAHRRYKHPKHDTTGLPDGAKEGARAASANEPTDTPDAPPVRATESGTPPEKDGHEPSQDTVGAASTPAAPTAPSSGARFDLSGHFDFGHAGYAALVAKNVTYTELMQLLAICQPIAPKETP